MQDFLSYDEIALKHPDWIPNKQNKISEISAERIRQVQDVVKEGDLIDVKVLEVDRAGRIKLSRKALLQ